MNDYQTCLYSFNAFLTVIPDMVMKFQNVDIFDNFVQFCTCCCLLTPAAW